jgi:hypothetical protein
VKYIFSELKIKEEYISIIRRAKCKVKVAKRWVFFWKTVL